MLTIGFPIPSQHRSKDRWRQVSTSCGDPGLHPALVSVQDLVNALHTCSVASAEDMLAVQVRPERGLQPSEQVNLQVLPIPLHSIHCPRAGGLHILHRRLPRGPEELVLRQGA